ncbi:MAG: FG-GAP repeat protein, partial [Anaerolineae bacterium]|nr:FG-GAP repeat protein [Anaerolineae bacterium]
MNANRLTFRLIIHLAARLGLPLILPAAALLLLIGLLGRPAAVNADAVPLTWQRPTPLADPGPISETPLLTLTGEANSSFGVSVASAGDVNGDGFADVLVGAYFYNGGQGRAYLYLGGAAGLAVTPALTLTGEAGSNLGLSVASADDVNGDGFADIIIGAYAYNSYQGRAYLYLGSAAGLAATPALTLTGEAGGDYFGYPVASAGDVNDDGYADVLVGAYGYNSSQGRAYLYLGGTAGLTATPALTLTGEAGGDCFGTSVASAGDVNDDGFADALVGAGSYGSGQGSAYLYLGSAAGLSAAPTLTLTGEATGNYFGASVASAGDVNNDSYDDVLVGAYGYSGVQGRAYLYLGSAAGLTATPTLTLTGETTNNGFGRSVASAGDVNSDGFADALVGADWYNTLQGRAYLYLGNTTSLTTTPTLTLTGEAGGNRFGFSVASAGDVNQDGYAEVIVGAPGYNSGQGRAYLYGYITIPDLAVVKLADPEPGVAGTLLTYTLVITNQGDVTATNTILTDTLHPSTTLHTVNQRDEDALDFSAGTHNNTRWNDDRPYINERLEQIDLSANGTYTSRVFDAGQDGAAWTTLSWRGRRPYWKPLPDNGGAEWGYDDGNVDMWGNRLLLHLDEAAAPFADSSGSGLSATCITCPVAGADGRFNDAVQFDGVDDVLVISDTHSPARYAVEMWVYPTTVTTSSLILRTDTVSGTEYHYSHMLGIIGDRFFHMVNDGGERRAIGTTTIVPNTWYHIVGTAESGGDLRLYVNGVEEAYVAELGTLWAGGDEYR